MSNTIKPSQSSVTLSLPPLADTSLQGTQGVQGTQSVDASETHSFSTSDISGPVGLQTTGHEVVSQAFGEGLLQVAQASAEPIDGRGPIQNVDDANAYAAEKIAQYFSDKGLDPVEHNVSIEFPRSMWEKGDFKNQKQLDKGLNAVAGFLAQMAEDRDGSVDLNVRVTPNGELEKTSGVKQDALYVPLNAGKNELELRKDWDDGAFIHADNWWNPLDHLKSKKLRAVWKVAGNPVGILRTKARRMFKQTSGELNTAIQRLQTRASERQLSLPQLREHATQLVKGFVSPEAKSSEGGSFLDQMVGRVAHMDESQVISMLGKWKDVANNASHIEDVSNFAVGASSNRLRDSTFKIGLVNVDTYDTVSVTPDSVMGRHGAPAINDVELSGTRIGLVNVSSTDMVTVVPNLARMIFGGSSLEQAVGQP